MALVGVESQSLRLPSYLVAMLGLFVVGLCPDNRGHQVRSVPGLTRVPGTLEYPAGDSPETTTVQELTFD